ncbi:MAG: tetratricopeptide repeat protein [Planctomycetota bacterium]
MIVRRSNRTQTCMLVVLALLFASSCTSLERRTRSELSSAESALGTQPEEALRRATMVLAKQPRELRAHRIKAQAHAALGQQPEALREWQFLYANRAALKPSELELTLRNLGLTHLLVLGDLPDRVDAVPAGSLRDALSEALTAFSALIELHPQDADARFGKAECQFRIGMFARAHEMMESLLAASPDNFAYQYLHARVAEQLVGATVETVNRYTRVALGGDTKYSRQAATHLVWLAGQRGIAPELAAELRKALESCRQESPELRNQLDRWHAENAQREADAESERLAREANQARQRGNWLRGWELLNESEASPKHEANRIEYAQAWANALNDSARKCLANESRDLVLPTLEGYAKLPVTLLTTELRAEQEELALKLRSIASIVITEDALRRARETLEQRRGPEALEILDEVAEQVPAELLQQFELAYAEALANWQRDGEALDLLDRLQRDGALAARMDEPVYRLYGVLLARTGRGEEAEKVLEMVPLHLFNNEAFEALLLSLEQRGNWEAVLARLQGLSVLPEQYRPLLIRCASQAAARRLRSGDAKEALALLDAYLRTEDFSHVEVQPVYLQILIGSEDYERATDLILTADASLLDMMPAHLIDTVKSKAEKKLSADQRFSLYLALSKRGADADLEQRLKDMWPSYGNYYPTPGNYVLRYKIQLVTQKDGEGEIEKLEQQLTWDTDHFKVQQVKGTNEEWRFERGVWTISFGGRTQRIPVRASGTPPYPVEQFQMDGSTWSAQIMAAGVDAEVSGKTYCACLKVRIINEAQQDQYSELTLAPEVGVVLREDYRYAAKVKSLELLSFVQVR